MPRCNLHKTSMFLSYVDGPVGLFEMILNNIFFFIKDNFKNKWIINVSFCQSNLAVLIFFPFFSCTKRPWSNNERNMHLWRGCIRVFFSLLYHYQDSKAVSGKVFLRSWIRYLCWIWMLLHNVPLPNLNKALSSYDCGEQHVLRWVIHMYWR